MKKLLLCGSLLVASSAFSQVLTEDFEGLGGALPAGWNTAAPTAGGEFYTGDAAAANAAAYWPVIGGTNFAMANDDVCNCDMSVSSLTTPSMNFTGMSGVAVTYDFVDDMSYGPSLPHWVEVSTDGGTTWTNVYTHNTNDQGNLDWASNVVALGAATDGAADVRVRWTYDDDGTWATGLAIDNVVVDALPAVEAELTSVVLPRYAATNANESLSVDVTNLGANAITEIQLNWNDGVDHVQTINGLNIASGATVNVVHPTPVNYTVAVEESIDVTIMSVNGGADANAANNAISATLHNTVSQIVPKKVVIEEGTGTWCGWCPRGAVAMDYMTTTYPDQFIGIAVHNGDPMTVTEYDNGASFSGFPGCNVDRALLDQSVSQGLFEQYYNARKDMIVPAGISIASSGTGANVNMDVTATFYTPFAAANYRLGIVMVENGVTGTSSGYNQTNYYAGGGNGAMGGYESLPDPVPAAQMVYDHVGVALVGGYNGQAGSVPAVITDGLAANQTFNYTVPGTVDRNNLHAVALLIDQTTGEIVTAEEVSVAEGAGLSDLDAMALSVFPNPASDMINISFEANANDYSVEILDLQGRVVKSRTYNNLNGAQLISFPANELATGSYMVKISTNEGSRTETIIVE